MAKLENLDLVKDKALLEAILSKLPRDDLWDVNIPREAALKEQGEPRFHYQKKNLTVAGSHQKDKDTINVGGDFKKADLQNMLADKPQPHVAVKVENPRLVEFKQSLTVLRSGKSSLEKQHAKALDLLPGMQEKNLVIFTEAQNACNVLKDAIDGFRAKIFSMEKVETPEDKDFQELKDEISKAEGHLDAFRRLIQKKKQACD